MNYFRQQIIVTFTSSPGSGKTYFSRQATERLGAVRLNSDSMRRAIFGSADEHERVKEMLGRPAVLSYVFNSMDYSAEQVVSAGHDLIYEANNNKREHRRHTQKLASKYGAVPLVVHLEVPYDVALKRIQEREDASDSRPFDKQGARELLDRIQSNTDPFDDDELVVNLDGRLPFDEQFAEFERQVKELIDSRDVA